jgi:hypothetical protein
VNLVKHNPATGMPPQKALGILHISSLRRELTIDVNHFGYSGYALDSTDYNM